MRIFNVSLFVLLIAFQISAQSVCEGEMSEFVQTLSNQLKLKVENCEPDIVNYPLNNPNATYTLRVAFTNIADNDTRFLLTPEEIEEVKASLFNAYSANPDIGINFEYFDRELIVGIGEPTSNRDNDCPGFINAYFTKSGLTDNGGFGSYSFFADYSLSAVESNFTAVHEMGHVLGLHHTFLSTPHYLPGEQQGDPNKAESVTRNPNDVTNCPCNCNSHGDQVCDTPAAANLDMFTSSPCSFNQDNTINDGCLPYEDPLLVITRNFMQYKNSPCRSLFSDGQIQRMKYVIETDEELESRMVGSPLLGGTFSNLNSIDIDTEWNTNHFFDNDLFVNRRLIIDGASLKFTEGHKLIINEGGNVILRNGATLDRVFRSDMQCGAQFQEGNWEGVELTSLNLSRPSKLDIYSGFIMNANRGIFEEIISNTVYIDLFLNGGTITNCEVSIELDDIQQWDFTFYNFVTDRTVSIKNLDGFFITYDAEFDILELEDVNSIFGSVVNIHKSMIKTELNVLNSNVYINDDSYLGKVIVSEGFDKSLIIVDSNIKSRESITARNILLLNINNNIIESSGSLGQNSHGIEIDGVPSFEVYNNEFSYLGTNSDNSGFKGVEIKNTEEFNNAIRNNILDGFGLAFRSNDDAGVNNSNESMGLYFECNKLENTKGRDFTILDDINPNQGSPLIEAGNTFAGTGVFGGKDFFITEQSTSHIHRYFYKDNPITDFVGIIAQFTQIGINTCAPGIEEETDIDLFPVMQTPLIPPVVNEFGNDFEYESAYNLIESQIISAELALNLDNGNTLGLYDQIDGLLSNGNYTQILPVLNNYSPNISNAIISLVMNHKDEFSAIELYQLLINNPVAIGEEGVYNVALNSQYFTANQKQGLLNALSQNSLRKTKKSELSELLKSRYNIIHQGIISLNTSMTPFSGELAKWIDRLYETRVISRSNFGNYNTQYSKTNNQPIIYPNPATEKIFIKNLANDSSNLIKIYNLQGELLIDKLVLNGESISLPDRSSGIHYYEILDLKTGSKHTGKFIVID